MSVPACLFPPWSKDVKFTLWKRSEKGLKGDGGGGDGKVFRKGGKVNRRGSAGDIWAVARNYSLVNCRWAEVGPQSAHRHSRAQWLDYPGMRMRNTNMGSDCTKWSLLPVQRTKQFTLGIDYLPHRVWPSSKQIYAKPALCNTYRPSNLCFKKSNSAFCIISVTCNWIIN